MTEQKAKWEVYGLIGAAQAADNLSRFLTNGVLEQNTFNAMVRSILVLDGDIEDIFGDNLSLWLNGKIFLNTVLSSSTVLAKGNTRALSSDAFYYFVSILKLSKDLLSQPKMLDKIGTDIEKLKIQIHERQINFEQVLLELNEIYKATISNLSFRIQVRLHRKNNFDLSQEARMRVLLFAGIRSAILWRQGGGTMPRLIFSRKKVLENLNKVNI